MKKIGFIGVLFSVVVISIVLSSCSTLASDLLSEREMLKGRDGGPGEDGENGGWGFLKGGDGGRGGDGVKK
ncbi:MAG: hypothetical protein JSS32_05385 [Verrucomicrobia bacterium]|nr:hypothetical protein [Verrucomicrobiota bacterium]